MSTAEKIASLVEWAKGWPGIGGYIKLNAVNAESGDASLSTDFTEYAVQEYICGKKLREMTFMLKVMADWSDGFDRTNQDAIGMAADWNDWVESTDTMPDWDAEILSVEATYDVPALSMVYQDEGLAEYVLAAKITYIE